MKHYDHYKNNKGYCMLLHKIEETIYDKNNNPIQTIIGNGCYKNGSLELDRIYDQIIYRTYDKNNRLIEIVRKSYCKENLMSTYTTNIYYDNNDNIKLIEDNTNRFTIIDYDDNNNIIKVISHYDPRDIIKCDLFNKECKIPIKNINTIPSIGHELKTLKMQYDKNNNCVEKNYNDDEITTRYIYNSDGKLIAENIFEYDEIISERTIIIDDNFNIENFTDHKDSDNSYRNFKSKNTNIEIRDKNGVVICICS